MFKKLGIGCMGLIGLLVVLSIFAALGGGGSESTASNGASVASSGSQSSGAKASSSGSTGAQGAAAKPTEGPKLGSSRSNPVPFGQSVTLTQGNKTFEVRVLEVQRDATDLVKEANSLNSPPKDGMAYVAIKMRLSYLKGPADKPHKTPSSGSSLFAQSRMWGTEGLVVPPQPEFGGIDIFPGATVDGWITPMQVPKDAQDEILLSWGKDLFGDGETWFALDGDKADAGPPPAIEAPPAPTSSKPGGARGSAIPFGEVGKIDDGKASFELSVIQVERNASAMVKKANMFNPDPHPGMEYLAIKMRLKYLSGPQDKPYKTPSSGMSVFAANRMWGTDLMTVPPEPQFSGQDIFPGAEVEGWLTPVMLQESAMDEAILSYGKDLFGGGETWFALK
ncbi:MAG: hypothetical protein ACOX87_08215 [Chloroflexota bacterium]|jgi:hypothetical protein